jgi:purine nucleosidase
MIKSKKYLFAILFSMFLSCSQKPAAESQTVQSNDDRIRLIIDTDANNELDDQHALAYAFANQKVFDIEGITVNNTINGDGIDGHYNEALRVMKLFNVDAIIPLYKGATKTFSEILPDINNSEFDGKAAVDFIIQQAKADDKRQLVLLPIGKLTNIALALQKAPEIKDKIKIVWLGSNYPEAGEYNLENDTTSVNPVIKSGAPFEMVVVRYGIPSGTYKVSVTRKEIEENMTGKGAVAKEAVTGRHGGVFKTFGDYSVNLFQHAKMDGDPPSRSLFDMAAVAILKNPTWATKTEIPAPVLSGNHWISKSSNESKIWLWENFNRDMIIQDLFDSMKSGK